MTFFHATATNPARIDPTGTTIQPVSGTITVNAGTNLNTSTLAIESGGNLATIASVVRAEDSAALDGYTGIPTLAVRKTTPANTSDTDGDYETLQMSAGRLWTSAVIDSALPAGTNAIGKLSANDGIDIGDTTINNGSGGDAVNIQDGGNSITVDGSVSITGTVTVGSHDVTNAGTFAVQVSSALPAGTNAIGKLSANSGVDIGDVDVTSVVPGTAATNLGKAEDAAHSSGDTGVMALAVRADAGATGNPTTLATSSGDYIPLATDSANRLYTNVAGDLAHDAADSTSAPVKIGGQARTTNPTAVADGDRVNAIFDKIGRQAMVMGQVRALMTHQYTQIVNTTAETTILASGGANVFHDITSIILTNASGTAVSVTIKDALAGTTRMVLDLAANGGAVINLPRPLTQAAANSVWTATLSVNTVTINITIQAEKNV
jgi:hypothetical protein